MKLLRRLPGWSSLRWDRLFSPQMILSGRKSAGFGFGRRNRNRKLLFGGTFTVKAITRVLVTAELQTATCWWFVGHGAPSGSCFWDRLAINLDHTGTIETL